MNILFIGHYRENNHDGDLSRSYLKCLANTGHNIVARPIYLNSNPCNIDPELEYLETKQFSEKPDIVIQNTRPEFFEKTQSFDIGLCNFNNISLTKVDVLDRFELLDVALVSNTSEANDLDSWNIPNCVIGVPVEDSITNNPLSVEDSETTFNFYFIDEYNQRTNLLNAIIAFNREFNISDNVKFIINAWIPGKRPQETIDIIVNDIKNVKRNMRLYKKEQHYLEEIVLMPNNKNLASVHAGCDCLIVPHRYNSVNIHALQALLHNNDVICCEEIYLSSLLQDYGGYVAGIETPSLDTCESFNSNDYWYDLDILDLQRVMRHIYNNRNKKKTNRNRSFILDNFSHDKITQNFNNVINTLDL